MTIALRENAKYHAEANKMLMFLRGLFFDNLVRSFHVVDGCYIYYIVSLLLVSTRYIVFNCGKYHAKAKQDADVPTGSFL